jgi:hypothetical protein
LRLCIDRMKMELLSLQLLITHEAQSTDGTA